MPDPPPVTGISELVLEVSDLEAARRFYRDLLGFEETLYGEGAEGRYWYLIGDIARLGLWTEQVGLAGGAAGRTSTSPSTSRTPRSTGCSSACGTPAPRSRGRCSSGPGGRSTSPTPTATWSSSGARTWPSTRRAPGPAGQPGTLQGRVAQRPARASTSSSRALRSAAPNFESSSAAICSRSLPSSAIFIATRRAAESSPPLDELGTRGGAVGGAGRLGLRLGGRDRIGRRLRGRLGRPRVGRLARQLAEGAARPLELVAGLGFGPLADVRGLLLGPLDDLGRVALGLRDHLADPVARLVCQFLRVAHGWNVSRWAQVRALLRTASGVLACVPITLNE